MLLPEFDIDNYINIKLIDKTILFIEELPSILKSLKTDARIIINCYFRIYIYDLKKVTLKQVSHNLARLYENTTETEKKSKTET